MFLCLKKRAARKELMRLALGGCSLQHERGMGTSFQHPMQVVQKCS